MWKSNWRGRLRTWRRDRGWSQSELGRRARPHLPVSAGRISEIEGATGPAPRLDVLEDLVAALGRTLADLFEPTTAVFDSREQERRLLAQRITLATHSSFERLVADIVDAAYRTSGGGSGQ